MIIPQSGRKKALIIVDVQPAFIKEYNKDVLEKIQELIKNQSYDAYVTAIFFADKGTTWDIQCDWTCPKDEQFYVRPEIMKALNNKKVIEIEKSTKSAFKGNIDLNKKLKELNIEELHIVGYETNDCVLATAHEGFDLGFITYIIEECCNSASKPEFHLKALSILRYVNLTNHSIKEKNHK